MSNKQGGKPGGGAKGKKGAAKGKAGDEKREDVLQAVVLVDSFEDRFKPFTTEKPRCLLPLANVPLIEHTLEFLASNGVQEVFIYCGAHSEAIETFINESRRWSPGSILSPFSSLEFIRVSDATSVGDFMRDLDSRGVIAGDFILVHGDVVSNIELEGALAKHRARREANRDACMTMVLTSAGTRPHPIKTAQVIKPVFVICNETNRCVHYQEMNPLTPKERLRIDYSLLEICTDTEIRSDLIDAQIDICTPEVLALWSESFDYELPRKNFLSGVIKDWELNGKLIYAEVMKEGYAVRASNLALYERVSRDVLNRRVLPFAPDSNLSTDQTYKWIHAGRFYSENGVLIDRTAKVTRSALGADTNIGAGSTIERSIIGRSCVIGKDVKIKDSYIWDDAVIGDGTVVERSILANSATVGSNCHIPKGSLLSFGVQIADGKRLDSEPIPRISLLDDDGNPAKTDPSVVGEGGRGALYHESVDEDSDDEDQQHDPAVLQRTLFYSLEGMNISADSVSTFASEDSSESDDEEFIGAGSHGEEFGATRQRLSSFTSIDSNTGASDAEAFHADAVHGLVDALQGDDSGDFDSAKLEFMGLRLANNASDSMMRRAIAVAFATRASELLTPEHGGLTPAEAAKKALFSKNGALKFIKEVGVGEETGEQSEFALALQKALLGVKGLEATRAGTLLAALLQQLYSEDVLEEDGILAWWADARSSEGDGLNKIKDKCLVLVEWLENAEEDSDDDEDDEDSD
ncbi:nucleotide-diphospho-sugar transferase [Rhypophila decipiens]|uniref:Mannose-1-phosphate guanyltransferase n=1 Tax=Rhypophila decipiens TaxID=261697 RepID=A0AAN6YHR2_9PEZI|nr:nucleotide-diphospho-sugar transferase [Rhypophila decipiens]